MVTRRARAATLFTAIRAHADGTRDFVAAINGLAVIAQRARAGTRVNAMRRATARTLGFLVGVILLADIAPCAGARRAPPVVNQAVATHDVRARIDGTLRAWPVVSI